MGTNTSQLIQELQSLEQQMSELLMQRQTLEVELNETNTALGEIKNSKEVYKISGSVMIKSDAQTLNAELEEKKKIISLRISSIAKQEKPVEDRIVNLQKQINDEVTKNKK
ncbi:MAG: prefoldin subunit beta, partial [archaeon]